MVVSKHIVEVLVRYRVRRAVPIITSMILASCLATIDESKITTSVADAGHDGPFAPGFDGGRDGDLEEAGCVDCPPERIAHGLENPEWIAVDDTYLYVTEVVASAGRIRRVKKTERDVSLGGNGIVTTLPDTAQSLVVTREPALYWTRPGVGGVGRAALPEGAAQEWNLARATAIAAANGKIYWASDSAGNTGVHVCTQGATCGDERVLAGGIGITAVVVRATDFLTSDLFGSIRITLLDGGQTGPIIDDGVQTSTMTANGTTAYWVRDDRQILGCPITQCETPVGIATVASPKNLIVDAKRLYWPNRADAGAIHSCPLAGCGIGTLPTREGPAIEPFQVAQDEATIYWSDRATGELWRKRKAP